MKKNAFSANQSFNSLCKIYLSDKEKTPFVLSFLKKFIKQSVFDIKIRVFFKAGLVWSFCHFTPKN